MILSGVSLSEMSGRGSVVFDTQLLRSRGRKHLGFVEWSGRLDLNQRPLRPERSALHQAEPRPDFPYNPGSIALKKKLSTLRHRGLKTAACGSINGSASSSASSPPFVPKGGA